MFDLTKQSCCFFSCFIYLTNAIIAYIYGYRNFSYLLILLWLTSIFYYSNVDNMNFNIIDRITVMFVICWTLFIFYKKCNKIRNFTKYVYVFIVAYILIFIGCLHCYDRIFNRQPDYETQYVFQSLLHFLSSFGIHIIILL